MSLPAYAMNRGGFPEMYEQHLVGTLFRPWVDTIFEEVAVAPGDSVMDVACGTGIVARVAKERLSETARVVGVDLSPQMLGVARTVAPGIDWREGNALALPLSGGERFDVIVCQQGLQFFPDKPAAAQQMKLALAPRGRLAIATWRPIEEMPFLRDLHAIAVGHVGPIVDQRHSFGDATKLEALLRETGLQQVKVRTLSRTVRFDDGTVFIRLNTMALVGMSATTKDMSEEARSRVVAAIFADSAKTLQSHTDERGLAFEMSTNLATGRAD